MLLFQSLGRVDRRSDGGLRPRSRLEYRFNPSGRVLHNLSTTAFFAVTAAFCAVPEAFFAVGLKLLPRFLVCAG